MTGTSTTYRIDIPGQQLAQDYRGVPFVVTYVEWRTYIFEGQAWRHVAAIGTEPGGEDSNCWWDFDREPVPEWVPRPPDAWTALADEIAAQAEAVAE